jgi:hypothetical protein
VLPKLIILEADSLLSAVSAQAQVAQAAQYDGSAGL